LSEVTQVVAAEVYRRSYVGLASLHVSQHKSFTLTFVNSSTNNILTPRPGFSCETQLILSIDDWALDSCFHTDVAIFEFSKAFDSVPPRLLGKLHYYGIRGQMLTWFSSCLLNHYQRVVVNGSQSSWSDVISGVPQGSVLGPLLFLLYINNITGNMQSNIRLFADDCIVYRTIRSQDDSCKLQNDISSLLKWTETWQMSLILRSATYYLSLVNAISLLLFTTLEQTCLVKFTVSSHTYLAITVSSDLKWHEHISNICLKATRTLNFVRCNTYCCSQEAKNLAYLSLVLLHLEYAAAAWDPYMAKDIQQLERVQHRAARFVEKKLLLYNFCHWSA